MTSKRTWAIRIGLLVGSVAATLGILELVLGREVADDGAFFESPPPGVNVPYVLTPDTEVVFEGHYVKIPPTTVRISSQGLRDDEVAPTPGGERRRVLMLGDSFVFGSGVEVEDTFAQRLEAKRADLDVVNMGVPGYTSAHAVELLAHRGLGFRPDGVVLFVSDNDFYAQGRQRREERRARGDQWALERYAEGRSKGRTKDASSWRESPEVVLERLDAALKRLFALGIEHGFAVRVFLLFPHPLEEQVAALGHPIERLADAEYLKRMKAYQIPKDLHPNAAGHAALATLLEARLQGWPPP